MEELKRLSLPHLTNFLRCRRDRSNPGSKKLAETSWKEGFGGSQKYDAVAEELQKGYTCHFRKSQIENQKEIERAIASRCRSQQGHQARSQARKKKVSSTSSKVTTTTRSTKKTQSSAEIEIGVRIWPAWPRSR